MQKPTGTAVHLPVCRSLCPENELVGTERGGTDGDRMVAVMAVSSSWGH